MSKEIKEKKAPTQTTSGKTLHGLVIVESPAKIKTISKFLGPNFKIVSTFGHVKDLPEREIGVEVVQDDIKIDYVPIKGKATVINEICKEAKKVDEVYLASDPDREGEMISFHIGEEIKKAVKDKVAIYRIVFNEITKSAVTAAIKNKHSVDQNKVSAQQARRILDRWVGYEISPILWKKISKGLSAGRVQSVAVLLICTREEEILAFVPEESWSIHATFLKSDAKINATLFKINGKNADIKTKDVAEKVLAETKKISNYQISEIIDKDRTKNPLPPFITSSLQQDAYNKLGFSVDKTMLIAQKLYEGVSVNGSQEALITYMRTDSTRLSETALNDARNFISDKLGDKYLPEKSINYSKDAAQDAHEAIRPISMFRTPESLKNVLEKNFYDLYELIWRRTIACQMNPALYSQRQVLLEGDKFVFKATGSTLLFDGFLKVYKPEEENEEKTETLPSNIATKEQLNASTITSKQHFTQPPARYNEASLVKELEKKGIGRPSTYATIMTTIQKRNYVEKVAKRFVPTELGKAVVKMLVENFAEIINISFTAKMEDDLDKIASGDVERNKILLGFYENFKKTLNKFVEKSSTEKSTKFVPTEIMCPKCNKHALVIRFSKSGEFLGCSGFPECSFTSTFERDENNNIKLIERQKPVELEEKCPQCGKNLIERTGRYGKFVACPGYPACKYIKKDPNAPQSSSGGFKKKFSKSPEKESDSSTKKSSGTKTSSSKTASKKK